MTITIKDDEQNWYICGQCNTKIFYLKSEKPPDICPECDIEIVPTGKYAGTAVGQHGDGEAQTAVTTVRGKGWEHQDVSKDDVPDKIKLDLNEY
jgi:DNA-directed RNA polymerase subunit RPC12/RpoP